MPTPIFIFRDIFLLRLFFLQHNIQLFSHALLFFYVGILYPSGKPILPHRLRYRASSLTTTDHYATKFYLWMVVIAFG